MFKNKSLIALAFGLLFLAGCSHQQASVDPSVLPDVIKIGFIGPLTGNAGAYGQDIKSGIDAYIAENPTLAGKAVQVIYEDGKCNGQDAANAAQKLITVDNVKFILGGQCSGETLAVAPIAEQNQVVLLSPLSSSPDVTTAGDYVFRNYPSDAKVSKTMVDDVLKTYKKVAALTEQTDYAQGFRESIKGHMANAGQSLVLDEVFSVDNTDFRTLLSKVKESGADVLIMIPQAPVTGGFIVKQAKEMGLNIQIYGGDTIPGPDFFNTAKDAAEGVKVVMVAEDSTRSGYAELKAKVTPQASELFPAFGYDAAHLVLTAIEKVGYDAAAVKDYFYAMPTYKGVASDVTFDANGDNNVAAGVKLAKNGTFELLK